jgi:sialidase-1
VTALLRNLADPDPAVRVSAAEFAPDARAVAALPILIKRLDDPVLDVRLRSAQALLLLAQPVASDEHEVIRRDVFPATKQHPRYSEGSLIVLGDGRLLYATTEFIGGGSDFASAHIIAVESTDGGRTWGERRVLQENVGKNNVMSVTLRRLSHPARYDAPLGLFYLIKNSKTDLQVFLRISNDDGKTFGEPVQVTNTAGYHVLNNDRVTVLSSGRIVVPVATTQDVAHGGVFTCSCFFSDDGGKSWKHGSGSVAYGKRGAMEPEVIELADKRLLMHFRTQLGHIAVSESTDGGDTWSKPRSWGVTAPEAPSTLRRIPSTGHLLLVWNDSVKPGESHGGKRTPLTVAISEDEGKTWKHKQQLETSPIHTYAYTSVAFDAGRVLLTYYVRDEKSGWISSRFVSMPIEALYREGRRQ